MVWPSILMVWSVTEESSLGAGASGAGLASGFASFSDFSDFSGSWAVSWECGARVRRTAKIARDRVLRFILGCSGGRHFVSFCWTGVGDFGNPLESRGHCITVRVWGAAPRFARRTAEAAVPT